MSCIGYFSSEIDPFQEYCLVEYRPRRYYIARRADAAAPICNHAFGGIHLIMQWYNFEWRPPIICPICKPRGDVVLTIARPASVVEAARCLLKRMLAARGVRLVSVYYEARDARKTAVVVARKFGAALLHINVSTFSASAYKNYAAYFLDGDWEGISYARARAIVEYMQRQHAVLVGMRYVDKDVAVMQAALRRAGVFSVDVQLNNRLANDNARLYNVASEIAQAVGRCI